jgi:transketolase
MQRYNSQSGYFAYTLHEEMAKNKDIIVLTGDVGYGVLDDIRDDYPDRFINVGAAEQSLLDIGVGLVMSGKTAICYSITSFLLYRAFETIRNYIDYERIPVILVGRGRDTDYADCGFSHWSEEDYKVMNIFKNIKSYWPKTNDEASLVLKEALKFRQPTYINLSKK